MNIQTLKYEIIEWITKTNDTSLLQTLKSIKDGNATAKDWFRNLSPEEVVSLERGIADHKKGDILNSKDFWANPEDNV